MAHVVLKGGSSFVGDPIRIILVVLGASREELWAEGAGFQGVPDIVDNEAESPHFRAQVGQYPKGSK